MPDFTQKYLPMDELVKWLVALLHPREQFSVTRIKAVRDHVNRARSAGVLPERQKKGVISIEVSSFLRWISRKSVRGFNWGEELKNKYPQLYVGIVIVDVSGVGAGVEVGYVSTGSKPKRLKTCIQELLKARSKITELMLQLDSYKEKEKKENASKQEQRTYGKSGGRGNSK